jgi:hypothetical protein
MQPGILDHAETKCLQEPRGSPLRKDQESKLKVHQPSAFQCPIVVPATRAYSSVHGRKRYDHAPPYPNKGVKFATQFVTYCNDTKLTSNQFQQ